MLPWSVMPIAGWPSALAAAMTSLTRAAPSSMENSVCRCKWVKESPTVLAPPASAANETFHSLWMNYSAVIRR